MRYASVCSGIEAASVAWEPLGWEPVWFSEIEAFPCAVLQNRFPEVPNLGDMTKIKGEDYNGAVDLLVGGTPCFAAGTMILTETGYRPIEEVKKGDMVVSHMGRLCRVLKTGSKIAGVGKIKVLGRPEITCTPDHPFLCSSWNRDYSRKSETYSQLILKGSSFVSAKESVGLYANRVPVHPSRIHNLPRIKDLSETDLMALAGFYVGDGYIRRWKGKNKKAVILCLSHRKLDIFKRKIGSRVKFFVSDNRKEDCVKLSICCTELAEWLSSNFGERSYLKKIPFWMYGMPSRLVHSFILAYVDTDGGWDKDGFGFSITTTSPALAYGVSDILKIAQVNDTVPCETTQIEGRTVHQRKWYRIEFHPCLNKSRKISRHQYCSKVRSFNDEGKQDRVYNIEVDSDHTYVANGICVHNCQGFSVAGRRGGLEDSRSCLALSFVRLLETMRPRWFVWENVPGCLSTAGGADFRRFIRAVVDVGYGVCWRVLDVQYTRVPGFPRAIPQRRRRVFVVGHFGAGGERAAEVLFEPHCMFGNHPTRRGSQKENPGSSEKGARGTVLPEVVNTIDACMSKQTNNQNAEFGKILLDPKPVQETGITEQAGNDGPVSIPFRKLSHGYYAKDSVSSTLRTRNGGDTSDLVACNKDDDKGIDCMTPGQPQTERVYGTGGVFPSLSANSSGGQNRQAVLAFENHSQDSRYRALDGAFPAILATAGTGGNNLPLVLSQYGETAGTLTARYDSSPCVDRGQNVIAETHGHHNLAIQPKIAIPIDMRNATRAPNQHDSSGIGICRDGDPSPTISTSSTPGVSTELCVRRLTPTECERLMGFPDGWTLIPWRGKNAEDCPDAPRYKALGNSMGVNVMRWIGIRIAKVDETLG